MTYPRIWPADHGVCADLQRTRGLDSRWLKDKGFPEQLLRILDNQPELDAANQEALDDEATTRGVYRNAPGLFELDPQQLIIMLCAFRWRVDWALWCNAELQESLIIRNRSRLDDEGGMGYWDELLSCPFLVVESLPAYDTTNLLCRKRSGMLSARLSVFDKVTIVLTDDAILSKYPAHQQYLTFRQLLDEDS